MPRSAGCFRPPRVLRSPPIDPFEQITELCGSDRHRPATARRPDEPSPLEPLGEQTLHLAIVPKTLDEVAAAPAKDKKLPAIGIVLEGLLNQERDALIALPHSGMSTRQPDPHAAWHRDHRRSSTAITRASAAASTPASTMIRRLLCSTISIRPFIPPASFRLDGQASGTTRTGTKPGLPSLLASNPA